MASDTVLISLVFFLVRNEVSWSTFCPIATPFGDLIYVTDAPAWSQIGYSMTQCATQCAFVGLSGNNALSTCRYFSYNKTSFNCSLFMNNPTQYQVDPSGNAVTYQFTETRLNGILWSTVSARQCDNPYEYNGQLYNGCRYQAACANLQCTSGNSGCCIPSGQLAFCVPSTQTVLVGQSTSPSTVAYVADSKNCSFPFTSGGKLFFGCSNDIPPATNDCHRSACYKSNRTLARCPPPADFVAQINNITVNVTGQRNQVTQSVFGWISFMRRQAASGDVNWNLYWDNYVNGFGFIPAYMWLGLERISQMNKNGDWKLRLEYQYSNGTWRSVEYWTFKLGASSTNYIISIAGFSGDDLDLLYDSNGIQFSTRDKDNDLSTNSCVGVWSGVGAWWYNSCGFLYLTAPQAFITPPPGSTQEFLNSVNLMMASR